jgi:ketosteroid isomerase-like protein
MNRRDSVIAGLAGLAAVAAFSATSARADERTDNPEWDSIRTLLKAHDEAMTNQDLHGVLATMTDETAIMGTGPGEIWVGPSEIANAYEHFFQDFEKGSQKLGYKFKIGGIAAAADMGWLMASGSIEARKDGKPFEVPLNLSVTVTKNRGRWRIAAMHFSTLTGARRANDNGQQ